MSASKKNRFLQKSPHVVGTIPSPEALAVALKMKPGAVDFFELRIDHFADDPAPLLRAAPRLKAPLIITVRHPAEGGHGALPLARRRELYAQFLPHAALLDLELRSLPALAGTVAEAQASGVAVIGSAHFFKTTPKFEKLDALYLRARAAGLDAFKIATLTRTPDDVHTLFRLLLRHPRTPISAMGMGPCGKLSRLLLAHAGSVLNLSLIHISEPTRPY